jgi:hypothetical protein
MYMELEWVAGLTKMGDDSGRIRKESVLRIMDH